MEKIRDEVDSSIAEVLDNTSYILGPKVKKLEEKIADYSDCEYGIGVSSGTDALLVSLMALDIQPGDIVITTDYSFFATAGVVSRLKAKPVFIDINPDSYNIDPQKLQQWINKNKDKLDKVKAIIPVYLYGQCAEMEPIMQISEKYDIPVIEDAAQSIGAKYSSKGKIQKAGSIGDIGCFSFYPTKNLGGIGDGGMVVTSNSTLAEKIRKLRKHGASPKYYHSLVGGILGLIQYKQLHY